jgi:hypothetical protein
MSCSDQDTEIKRIRFIVFSTNEKNDWSEAMYLFSLGSETNVFACGCGHLVFHICKWLPCLQSWSPFWFEHHLGRLVITIGIILEQQPFFDFFFPMESRRLWIPACQHRKIHHHCFIWFVKMLRNSFTIDYFIVLTWNYTIYLYQRMNQLNHE